VPSKDPVCGMEVEPGRGYSEVFGGHRYRFCSRNCLDQFDANPQQFADA
jgi:YHS domain-containing protein